MFLGKKKKQKKNSKWWTVEEKHNGLNAARIYTSWLRLLLPLACCMNSESATTLNDFDPFPVQSKEWYKFQSASAHNLLWNFGQWLQLNEWNNYAADEKKLNPKIQEKKKNNQTSTYCIGLSLQWRRKTRQITWFILLKIWKIHPYLHTPFITLYF